MPKLIVCADDRQPVEVLIRRSRMTIGRRPSCDIVLDTKYSSKLHASLARKAKDFFLSDEGSKNGVFVNGDRILGPYRLRDGDEISIAGIRLLYVHPTATDDTADFPSMSSPARQRGDTQIAVDETSHAVWIAGRRLNAPLSRQEFTLLRMLCEEPGRVCSREALGDGIWGRGNYDLNMLHRLVFRVKAKLRASSPGGEYIVSVPGVGYRIETQ